MKENISLSDLIKERDLLQKNHLQKSFSSKEELSNYIKAHETELERLKELQEQIQKIKYENMTESEKQNFMEEQKKIKDKYSDD